jgi:hypothetical protein
MARARAESHDFSMPFRGRRYRHRGKRGCPFQHRYRRQYVGQFRFEHRPRLRRADHGREPDDVWNRDQHLRASGRQLGSEPCCAETPAHDAHRRCGGQRVDSANPILPMPASAGQTEVAKKLTGLQVNRSARHGPARACAARSGPHHREQDAGMPSDSLGVPRFHITAGAWRS